MAENLISSILGDIFSQTLFVIGGPGGAQATTLKITKVSIKYVSTPMRHKREDGTTIVDVRILKPTTVMVETLCPDLDTQEQINKILMDRNHFYFIQSKGLVIDNLMVDHDQVRQNADVLSAAPISISFKQIIVPVIDIMGQTGDAVMYGRGMTILSPVLQTVNDLYTKATSTVAALL